MASNNPNMRDLIKIVESRYSISESEMIPVKDNFGNVIGHVWQEGPGDWQAEESLEGMSWGMIDTQAEAEELIRDVYDEVDHYKSTIEEDGSEKLLYPPTVYDGEGNEHPYDIYHTIMNTKKVGDTVSSSAAAPGMGVTVDRITRMDDTGVYGVQIKNTVQIMEPWMVEDSGHGCAQCGQPADGNEELCSECAGGFYESNKPYTGKGGEPYATMSDGPDKYLFRKDQKQKLVGSADNEPKNGEEELEEAPADNEKKCHRCDGTGNAAGEYACGQCGGTGVDDETLEETTMDKEIREMQIAAGIIVAEEADEESTKCGVCGDEFVPVGHPDEDMCPSCIKDYVGEGKLPDALKKHQFGAKDDDKADDKDDDKEEVDEDCDTGEDKNDDGECSPLTHTPEKEETIDEDSFIEDLLLSPEDPQGPEVDEDDMIYGKSSRGKSYGPKDFHKFGDGKGRKDPFAGVDTSFSHEEPLGDFADDNDSDFPHDPDPTPSAFDKELDEAAFTRRHFWEIADLLTKIEDPEIRLSQAEHFAEKFAADNPRFKRDLFMKAAGVDVSGPELDHLRHPDDIIDEGPGNDEGALNDRYDDKTLDCAHCGDYYCTSKFGGECPEIQKDLFGIEEGPGQDEFSLGYTDDTMIDVGDEEDYKVYDFDSEFETMLGGSSDPVGNIGAGSMYEMNEIRRLAGMEPIEEKKADKDYDGDGKVESEEDEYKGSKNKAIKKELDEDKEEVDCPECEGTGYVDRKHCKSCNGQGTVALGEGFPGSEFPDSDVVAYEIDDEKAYYVMADLLGADLDFGPEDEILVPAERNDQIIAALTNQGFKLDRDYRVAGQMMDDLQNGYNDRAFTKGQDYFPRGAQSTPASDLGPSASGMADNPMSNKMRMVQKDEVYETMKLAYRRHRKA